MSRYISIFVQIYDWSKQIFNWDMQAYSDETSNSVIGEKDY